MLFDGSNGEKLREASELRDNEWVINVGFEKDLYNKRPVQKKVLIHPGKSKLLLQPRMT